MRLRAWLSITLLFLFFTLVACSSADGTKDPEEVTVMEDTVISDPTTVTADDTPGSNGTLTEPTAPNPPDSETPLPPPAGFPPQTNAAEIKPPEMREQLTRLSNLLGFQAVDINGTGLGTTPDYIINTCETFIIYFILEPSEALNYPPGSVAPIPFEAVTINSGALDAQARAIELHLTESQFANAPTYPASFQLVPTEWENDVRAFWSPAVRLGPLSTGCNVSAGTVTVYKVAYASDLLGAGLHDGLQNPLGTVEEAILEPETGKLGFFVINLIDGQGLVLVPLAKVNIPEEALEPGAQISLVLLTENDVLLNAPRINSVEEATSPDAHNTARQYWFQ